MFVDRADAGRRLAQRLAPWTGRDVVVLALPRGGVTVAFEVAKALDAPLDLLLVHKIGAPGHAEYGIGAVADGPEPVVSLDQRAIARLGIGTDWIEAQTARQLAEIERRRSLWLGHRPPVAVAGRTALVVDDGVATGGTMRVALRAVRRRVPQRVVMAVPVAAPDALEDLTPEADETVCLMAPPVFFAVGAFYDDFRQVTDREVTDLLTAAAGFGSGRGTGGGIGPGP